MPVKKKTETKIEQEPIVSLGEASIAVEPEILVAKAYSLHYVPKKGHTLFEISFNPLTGTAAVTKQESFGTDRVLAKEKFKLAVVKAKILQYTSFMSKTKPDQNAFPDTSGYGLSKREYFACAIATGVMPLPDTFSGRKMSMHMAVQLADELINALNERKENE